MLELACVSSLSALVLSVVLTRAVIWLAPKMGLVDIPGGRKGHIHPTPLGGGVAMFVAFGIPLLIFRDDFIRLIPAQFSHIRISTSRMLWVFLIGGGFMAVVGALDDKFGLRPFMKLLAQVAIGIGVYFFCPALRITLFVQQGFLIAMYTVVWMVVVTNAFNLMDNMDGLSAGVALVICVVLFSVGVDAEQWFLSLVALLFCTSLVGFLIFNFPPAKVFMGDAGSLFIGFIMWGLTSGMTYYSKGQPIYLVVMPLLLLGVPLYDMVSVILIRVREGRPIFQGDRSHFSHRLVGLGMTVREAVLTIYLVSLTVALTARLLYRLDASGAMTLFIQTLSIFAIIYVLERTGRRH